MKPGSPPRVSAPEPGAALLRYAAKALIVEAGRLLCLKKRGDIGLYYVLPGGGQNPGELLPAALQRECREELGYEIEVGPLRFVQEYVGANHGFRDKHGGLHTVNLYFECRLRGQREEEPSQPDSGQIGTEWIPLAELPRFPLYPKVLAETLARSAGVGEGKAPEREIPAGPPSLLSDPYLGDSV